MEESHEVAVETRSYSYAKVVSDAQAAFAIAAHCVLIGLIPLFPHIPRTHHHRRRWLQLLDDKKSVFILFQC